VCQHSYDSTTNNNLDTLQITCNNSVNTLTVKNMNKQALFGIIGVLALAGIGGAIWATNTGSDTTDNTTSSTDGELSIITTLYPQYDFARTIAPEAEVEFLLPAGTEPHSYEPTPKDIESIRNADLFIYTGESMEPWVEDLISDVPQDRVLDLSASISLMESEHSHDYAHSEEKDHDHADEHSHDEHAHDDDHSHEGDHSHDEHGDDHSHNEDHSHEHEEEHSDHSEEMEKDHDHEHGEFDPHYWLDFTNAVTMVETIEAKLSEIDSTNATTYATNSQALITDLEALDASYASTLSQCEENTLIIAGHSAFGYLTERYGLTQEAAQGFSPNAEPSSTRVAELIELVNAKEAGAVFTEELLSDRLGRTISAETGAQVLQITPAGNISREDLDANVTFIDIMESNLESFATGLSCR
jgi:zinc transport system substrate-binding protein